MLDVDGAPVHVHFLSPLHGISHPHTHASLALQTCLQPAESIQLQRLVDIRLLIDSAYEDDTCPRVWLSYFVTGSLIRSQLNFAYVLLIGLLN